MKNTEVWLPYKDHQFNATWAAALNVDDFVKHESHHGLSATELKEVHKLCKEAVKPAPAEK